MDVVQPCFARSDSWLLAVIVHAGGRQGAGLRALIAFADYYDRMIPTYEELSGGLERLLVAGYVEQVGASYRATEQVLSLLKPRARPAICKDLEVIHRFLGTASLGPAHPKPPAGQQVISPEAYEQAVREYMHL